MAYAPITKLDNFTGEEDNAQVWLNDSLVNKLQDFNAFKVEFLRYFSNKNSINHLVNTFTTMKQGETEAVTTYLECFHRNLRQIQAIDANYFTAPQILNQFIHGLRSSILQHVQSLHPGTLQDAVTRARDFESAESKANHAQAVNLVMNGSSKLDSKLEKFSESINKRLEGYLADNHAIYQPPQRRNNQGNFNHAQNQPRPSSLTNQQWQQEMRICHYCGKQEHIQIDFPNSESISKSKPTYLSTSDAVINLSISGVSSFNLSAIATSNLSTTAATNNLSTENDLTELKISNGSPLTNPQFFTATIWITPAEFGYWSTPEPKFPELFKSPAFAQKQLLTSNILPATITENKSLAAIFPFEFEKTTTMPLFSGAALEAKPITIMYTDAKVERQSIKLILDSVDGVTKTPIGEIDDFSFEINGIMTSIKVLVMEATQYQALVGQHIRVPTMCGHFKTPPKEKLLIELEKEKEKPTWEAYQVSWADADHNELPPILS
ncbi:hypothetical protein G9A89_022770 [Geosiphon pyriformis]|nr:hypothetical protein G9A89_022770 [Geosiphon pyriformis]